MHRSRPRQRTLLVPPLAAVVLLAACASDETPTDLASTTDTVADTAASASEPTEPPTTEPPVVDDPVESTEPTASTEPVEPTEPTDGSESTSTVSDIDGDSSYLGSYTLMDEEFGTMTTVTVDGTTRTIVSNALPDHATGDFPNEGNPNTISEQDVSYEFTTEPIYVGDAEFARTPGVAVNGVKFEPATAETVTCASGETLRVEALQEIYDLGLDFNNAHVQPTGEYHYHGISELLAAAYETDDDLVHIGFAADGHLMYSSKSGAYASGYALTDAARSGTDCVGSGALGGDVVEIDGTTPDGTYTSDWVWSATTGDLDDCNGVEIDGEYAYIVTDEYPYVGRCLNGEFDEAAPGGPPGG